MPAYVDNCPRCRGTRRVVYAACEKDASGKVTKFWTYEAECPRCRGAELFLESMPRHVAGNPSKPA